MHGEKHGQSPASAPRSAHGHPHRRAIQTSETLPSHSSPHIFAHRALVAARMVSTEHDPGFPRGVVGMLVGSAKYSSHSLRARGGHSFFFFFFFARCCFPDSNEAVTGLCSRREQQKKKGRSKKERGKKKTKRGNKPDRNNGR